MIIRSLSNSTNDIKITESNKNYIVLLRCSHRNSLQESYYNIERALKDNNINDSEFRESWRMYSLNCYVHYFIRDIKFLKVQ